jgi:hypothetical protein
MGMVDPGLTVLARATAVMRRRPGCRRRADGGIGGVA